MCHTRRLFCRVALPSNFDILWFMKIGVIGSMQFTEQMLKVKEDLISLDHDAFLQIYINLLLGRLMTKRR